MAWSMREGPGQDAIVLGLRCSPRGRTMGAWIALRITEQGAEGTLICSVILGAADLRWSFGGLCLWLAGDCVLMTLHALPFVCVSVPSPPLKLPESSCLSFLGAEVAGLIHPLINDSDQLR